MATVSAEDPPVPEAGESVVASPGPKKHEHEQTAGLEKVTDFVEEQEISAGELGQARVKIKNPNGLYTHSHTLAVEH